VGGVSLRYDVVIPTAGRATLGRLLTALLEGGGPAPERVMVVDDGAAARRPGAALGVPGGVTVLPGEGRGPAAARNRGWRAARAPWVAFLDDDVVPPPAWGAALEADLAGLGPEVAGSQGRVRVPLPAHRRPTDWERNVAGLEHAVWATADMAFRREALARAGGFDERFAAAYREDADLALRLLGAGSTLACGARWVEHPVPPAGRWVSVGKQRGNAEDVLMRGLHGRGWRRRAAAPGGRLRRHLATAAAGVLTVGAAAAGRRRAALAAGAVWTGLTAELSWARIAPGPRTREEVATMLATSASMPFAASWHWGRGWATLRRRLADAELAPLPAAVLLDRDGTLVADVPFNGDPARVRPVPGARAALDRLRAAGIPVAVISNQSGVGRGLLTRDQVDAVNRRVEELLGPLGPWLVCPHAPEDRCGCRKPAPGLVLQAAARLGVDAAACAVIGDIGADVEAARAAGARGVLVPTPQTRREEVDLAPETARDLTSAVELLLGDAP
jgi:histidinol-phosphate phosphatase family protein